MTKWIILFLALACIPSFGSDIYFAMTSASNDDPTPKYFDDGGHNTNR